MKRVLTDSEIEKLKQVEKDIKRCAKIIAKMRLKVYLNSGGLSLMDGEKHLVSLYDTPDCKNELFSISVRGWDGGDW